MLLIFDIDGTLCDTHEVESRCYAQAVEAVTGRSLATVNWAEYPEVTSAAIARGFLTHHHLANPDKLECDILAEFVRRLQAEARRQPDAFRPIAGAPELLRELQTARDCSVAIATGCWAASAQFKLRQSGLDASHIPFASCSDTPKRKDIIQLAVQRAGGDLREAVYVGDGPWDFKATRELGIPFIGIGDRHQLLRESGATHTFPDYTAKADFYAALEAAAAQPKR